MKMSGIVARLLTVVLLAEASVLAFESGRSNGLAGTPMLTDASAATALRLPTASMGKGRWRIELGGIRQYGLSELDEFYAAGAFRKDRVQVAVGVSQFGDAELYRELSLAAGLGWHAKYWAVGVTAVSTHLAFGGGYEGLSALSLGAYGGGTMGETRLVIGVDNFNRPSYGEGTPEFEQVYSFFLEHRYSHGQAVTGRVQLERDRKPRFGLGHRFEVGEAAALFWGLSSEPLTFGGGVDIMHRNVRLTYAASYHPVLGMTHTVSAAWSGK